MVLIGIDCHLFYIIIARLPLKRIYFAICGTVNSVYNTQGYIYASLEEVNNALKYGIARKAHCTTPAVVGDGLS